MLSLLLSLLRMIGKSLVYGGIFALITGVFFAYAAGPNGLFGDYFSRMVGSCGGDGITTGFDATPANYGTRLCRSFKAFLGDNSIYPNGGNVGIGINNPAYKLDVNGDIRALGNTQANRFYDGNDGNYYVDPNGNSIVRTLTASGGNIYAQNFFYASDERKKENITTLQGALDIIENLRGVRFYWREDKKVDIGFIAQEVEKVLPELVHTDSNGYKSVEYGNITAILVEGFHTLSNRINVQEAEIAQLRHEIELLKQTK